MPCFTELYTFFYVNGIKIVPKDIYNLLTPLALAHIIMGDGAAHQSGLIICTNSYSIQEVVSIVNVLILHYRLDSSISIKRQNNKIEYMVYIKKHSMSLLRSLVIPYFHSSMFYKILL